MSKKGSKESKLSRYLKAPIRILIKGRDFYIKNMAKYSDGIGYATVLGCPTGQVNTLPRSFSVGSEKSGNGDDDDLRELIKAASTRSLGNKVQLELLKRQQARQSPNNTSKMPRSHNVGIGRIDEEKPCDFAEDHIKVKTDVFPRSKSYAVTKRNGAFL
ncbi:hypothetical protein PTKIN_Ptkin08bG0125000 [Pterospermum kingtungense]